MGLFEALAVWLALGALVGAWAQNRGHSFFGFMALSVLLSPLVGCIAVLVLPDKAREERDRAEMLAQQIERDNERRLDHERQLEQLRAMTAAAQYGGPAPASVADELAKLATLKDGGVITQEEFDAQKRKVLGA